ncbi:Cof-type HAD-IIB family hydrolase [Oceanobacillus manasiensis]|uniref:Cof-type HAD-IIB family hydrolase n=1 Tax=Oceanobacillus manasiensis TaxID=586413 RepID=UPI0005A747AF|nr:Cof-type HAD-IIB family hydrolase [Oceanobacillus manasiensis]
MKLIAIDLDGTLLSSNSTISEGNVEAIKSAQEEGHIVAISSGRSLHDTREIMHRAGITCPIITGNGAKSFHAEEYIHNLYFTDQVLKLMMDVLNHSGLYYEIYTKDGVLVEENGREQLEKEVRELGEEDSSWAEEIIEIQYQQHGLQFVSQYDDIDFTGKQVYKLFVMSFHKEELEKLRDRIAERTDISITTSSKQKLEIGPPEASKGHALELIAQYFSVPMEYTVAIGDNFNDLSMFEKAGISIAMGNAEAEVKQQSTYVTGNHNEDGVAEALKKYVLNEQ